MLIKKPSDVKPSEITPPELFARRRLFIKGGAGIAGGLLLGAAASGPRAAVRAETYPDLPQSRFSVTDEEPNTWEQITTYNNFYEFGTGKDDPAANAHALTTRPWSVTVDGECEKPGVYDLEDILKPLTLEERIYRLRCVEAWSMVIPWVGFPLADLIQRFRPTSKAKYVEFETLFRPEEMHGQKWPVLDWPYREGLRMDEAMHPLTLMAVGLYGKEMPNQNGAPLRLVVPWKYGFKSIKSIVRLNFRETQPPTSWNIANGREYGFYSNVNPEVDHPRWSQARERRIGEFFKRETLMFNGYAEQVADLYRGMDLSKQY